MGRVQTWDELPTSARILIGNSYVVGKTVPDHWFPTVVPYCAHEAPGDLVSQVRPALAGPQITLQIARH